MRTSEWLLQSDKDMHLANLERAQSAVSYQFVGMSTAKEINLVNRFTQNSDLYFPYNPDYFFK
jgi:hypothetical protein